jgi:hypothetical protein
MFTLGWMPLLCLGIALAWRIWPVENRGFMPRWIVLPLLWFPILWINYTFFYHHGWYFKGSATSGVEALEEGAWADINSGLSLASLDQIKATLAVDDHTVREMQGLVAGRPGNTTVVWEQGLTAWRKAAYYAPEVPIVVLEHKKIRSSPPVIVVWKGARLERRLQGGTPLRLTLPAGSRVVWLLNSRTDFFATAQQNFALTAAGPVWFTDLPSEHGTRLLGEYEISW